jgi:type VI secretion system protein VasJ
VDAASLGRQPISAERPCGADARYEPEFELLQAEIDKLSLPSASGTVSWEKVARLSSGLLAEKSKDLRIACYWALSRVHARGIEGLIEGATLIRELMRLYWDDLYPSKKRLQGRTSALQWWIEKTAAILERLDRRALSDPQSADLAAVLEAIDALMRTHLPDPPRMRPVQRAVDALRIPSGPMAPTGEAPGQGPPGSPSAVTPTAPLPPATPAPGPAAEPARARPVSPTAGVKAPAEPAPPAERPPPATAEAAHAAVGAALDELRRACARLLDLAPGDPASYRGRRLAAWMRLSALPPAQEDRTQVPPPPPQAGRELAELAQRGHWPALLQAAEPKVAQHIFWLDLQRWSAAALEGLGADYRPAAEAVRGETAALLERLPGLESLCFSNGVPFADPDTRSWLGALTRGRESAAPESASAEGPPADRADEAEAQRRAAVAEAQRLVRAGNLFEATRLIDAGRRRAESPRSALLWRQALCRLLLESRKPELALPHAEGIVAAVDRYRLERWEPDFARDLLKTAWEAYDRQGDKNLREGARAVFGRIARIDPLAALKLSGS